MILFALNRIIKSFSLLYFILLNNLRSKNLYKPQKTAFFFDLIEGCLPSKERKQKHYQLVYQLKHNLRDLDIISSNLNVKMNYFLMV